MEENDSAAAAAVTLEVDYGASTAVNDIVFRCLTASAAVGLEVFYWSDTQAPEGIKKARPINRF